MNSKDMLDSRDCSSKTGPSSGRRGRALAHLTHKADELDAGDLLASERHPCAQPSPVTPLSRNFCAERAAPETGP